MKTVSIKFLSSLDDRNGGRFTARAEDDLKMRVHDIVLVKTDRGLALAQIEKIEDELAHTATLQPILDNLTEKSDHLAALAKVKRNEDIKKEINERMAVVDEVKKMEMYAASDERIAKLLKQLEE